ncbi:MAG: phosphoglycolate phosphatase [Burkholderiales bacterium]|nr:phosphoglycolate phosphatase [Burkholderiales bacterium]
MAARFARPGAVLFDLDGTLADTAPDLAGALNALRLQRGLAPLPVEALRPYASAGARGLLGAGLDLRPDHADYEAHRVAFLDLYEQMLDRDSRLFDGIEPLLSALEDRGIPWGVVTNKSQRFTPRVVAGLGLDRRASVVVSGDTTPHAKPHPAPLLHACAQIGVEPAAAIYVGDDLRDVQAARAAGMPAVAAAYGYLGEAGEVASWGADAVIQQPAALLDLIDWRD